MRATFEPKSIASDTPAPARAYFSLVIWGCGILGCTAEAAWEWPVGFPICITQVIRELLGAVETYDVCFAVSDTRMIDRTERTRQVPMRAVE